VKRQVEAMNRQAASMRTLADANKVIADAANRSAEASKRVADSSAQQLEVTDRPWVRVAMSVDGPVTFLLPEVASDPVKGAVLIPAELVFTNAGRSVANDLRVELRMTFLGPKSIDVFPGDADNTAAETCKSAAASTLLGKVLFPSENVPEHREIAEPIPTDAIYEPLPQSFRSFGPMGKSVQLLFVGCVAYKFSSTSALHRTWFTYRVGRRTAPEKAPFQTWSFEIGKKIPAQDIFLEKLPYGGNGAD
jgi:hypothetical protein